jgi:hypothetical protein
MERRTFNIERRIMKSRCSSDFFKKNYHRSALDVGNGNVDTMGDHLHRR